MTPAAPASELLPVVRALHDAKDRWHPKFMETGEIDGDAFEEMQLLRRSLYDKPPATAIDALLILGAIRSVASFGLGMALESKHLRKAVLAETTQHAFAEILVAIVALRGKLEPEAGHTLQELGFFTDEATRQ